MPIASAPASGTISVHGVLLSVYGLGVLLSGASGSGKSTLAWQLLQRGHALVSDDAPLLTRAGSSIHGCADPILQNLLHVRGVGVLDVAKLLGRQAVQKQQHLDILLNLTSRLDKASFLETPRQFRSILGVCIPKLSIDSNTQQRADLAEALLRAELVLRYDEAGHGQLQRRLDNALQAAAEERHSCA